VSGNDPGAGSAGAILRSAREVRDLSMSQVAEQLRLSAADVSAMEEDRCERLGPPVFVRGHLRKYAVLVGADPEAVLEAHARIEGTGTQPSSLIPPASAHRPVQREPRWFRPALSLLVIVLVVMAAAAAGWWAWGRFQASGEGEAAGPPVPAPFQEPSVPVIEPSGDEVGPAAAPADTEAADEGKPTEATGEPRQESQATAPPPVRAPATARDGQSAGLVLSFSGSCWLEVYDAAGRRLAYELAQPGESRRYAGPGPWRVVLGNVLAARLVVNGAEVSIPGRLMVQNTASLLVDGDGNVERVSLPVS